MRFLTKSPGGKFSSEPGARRAPLTINGSRCHTGKFSDLLNGEPTEKAHLGDLSPTGIDFLQTIEHTVNIEQPGRVLFGDDDGVIEQNLFQAAASFFRIRHAGVVDQEPPHDLRRNDEEVAAVFEIPFTLINESKPCLMHKCCGLQRMVGSLPPHEAVRDAAEFIINENHQRIAGTFISRL